MSVIQIDLTSHGLDQVSDFFNATEKQIQVAKTHALRKTIHWLKREISRDVAREKGVLVRSVADQCSISKISKSDDQARLFILGKPLDPMQAGNPGQFKAGVKMRGHLFPGAFIQTIYGGKEKVWIRRGSKHFNPGNYPGVKQGAPKFGAAYGRYPVSKVTVPISEEVNQAAEKHEPLVPATFLNFFRQRLNYEVNVK